MRKFFFNIISDLKNILIFFLVNKKKSTLFFNENEITYEYIKTYINRNNKKNIIFFSLKKFNFSLNENVKIVILNKNFFIDLLFLCVRSKYVYSTTPGLNFTSFKRSVISKYTKYIYIQHSPVSLTMAYDKNAFINFDAIQAINKFQYSEIIKINKIYQKRIKVFKSRYKFLEMNLVKKDHDLLVAPTWKTNFYSSGFYLILLNKLIKKKIDFIFRPHYMSLKKNEIKINQLAFLGDRIDLSSKVDLTRFNNLVSDWSGIFLEFAISNKKKPHLFYSQKKILNTYYKKQFGNVSFEEFAREKICFNYDYNQVDLLIDNLVKKDVNDNFEIKKFIEENFYL